MRNPKERPARQVPATGRAKNHSTTSNLTAAGDPVQGLLDRLEGVRQTGKGQWEACCPAHDDQHASLSVGQGDDGRVLMHCHAGCARADVLKAMSLTDADLFPEPQENVQTRGGPKRIVATYDYKNPEGDLLYQVVRYKPKTFQQRRPDGNGGWIWSLKGVQRVPYRLPELLAADKGVWVFVLEGEKDCDNVATVGLVTTTNPGGAGKWSKLADDSALHGRRVAIIADRDKTGVDHAQDVAARLHDKAAMVKVIDLPDGEVDGRPIKDVSDWLDALDSKSNEDLAAGLVELAEAAAPWTPDNPASFVRGTPVLTCLADVQAEPIRWLWPERIALGKVTLLVGDPGLGKSFITLDMAARVSTGTPWPDCPQILNPVGGVVLLSAEDDLADTIRPRLDAAGADVSRIMAMEAVKVAEINGPERQGLFNLAKDIDALAHAIEQTPGCRLVILDPITAYLGGTDSHKNAEIRSLLAPLSDLASNHGVAVVAVTHNRKGDGSAIHRAMGSLAFIAAARAAFSVGKDPGDPTGRRRFMVPTKNNIGNDETGLAYTLASASCNDTAVVEWEADPVEISADDLLATYTTKSPGPDPVERDEATVWLAEALADGPRPAKELLAQAKKDGISEGTLKRAKRELGVIASKDGWDGGWVWRLPHDGQEPGRTPITCAPSDDPAPLRKNKGLTEASLWGDSTEGNEGAQVPECREADPPSSDLDPDRPGPIDLLTTKQRERYMAIYHSRSASMSTDQKHRRAWRAATTQKEKEN